MILTYVCEFGIPLPLALKLAGNVELECIEFVGALPIEWRLVSETGDPLTNWCPGRRLHVGDGLRGFHDLQRPMHGGTRGLPARGATLETRGIGISRLLVWPREGTYRELALTVMGNAECGK